MTRKNILFYSSILINLVIAILGSIAIITQFFVTETYNAVDTGGINIFRFFTNDGNIICILVSYISLFFLLRKLFNKDKPLPKFIYQLKLISAVTGAIIFLVVFLILGPLMGGLQMMISGFRMSVLHVVNPILCVLSFLVLEENENKKSKRHALIGASAVYVYVSATPGPEAETQIGQQRTRLPAPYRPPRGSGNRYQRGCAARPRAGQQPGVFRPGDLTPRQPEAALSVALRCHETLQLQRVERPAQFGAANLVHQHRDAHPIALHQPVVEGDIDLVDAVAPGVEARNQQLDRFVAQMAATGTHQQKVTHCESGS